jgi:hypothetical protein
MSQADHRSSSAPSRRITSTGVYVQQGEQGKRQAAVLDPDPVSTRRTAGLAAREYFHPLLRLQPLEPSLTNVSEIFRRLVA